MKRTKMLKIKKDERNDSEHEEEKGTGCEPSKLERGPQNWANLPAKMINRKLFENDEIRN